MKGGREGIEKNENYDKGMMKKDNYGKKKMEGKGEDG